MNSYVRTSAVTTTKTNASTHCKLIQYLPIYPIYYFIISIIFLLVFVSRIWHHTVFIIVIVFSFGFGYRFSSFALEILLDTIASNTVQTQFIQIERLRAHEIYIIKANNDDEEIIVRREKGSRRREKRQTEANYSFYFERVCAQIMTRADSRANLSHQFDDPSREKKENRIIKPSNNVRTKLTEWQHVSKIL